MNAEERHPGRIPPHYRRLTIVTASSMAVLLFGFGIFIKLVLGIPVSWFWLIVAPIFITGLILLFLWVRLSD